MMLPRSCCAAGFRLALPLLLLAGCAPSDRLPVYPVRGQVLDARRQPAADALVVFHPLSADGEAAVRPLAYADAQGNFTLTTYQQGDGAPAGEYAVTLEWREKRRTPFAADGEGADRLQGRYRDPASSPFRFTVKEQSQNDLPAIVLASGSKRSAARGDH